MAETIKKFGVSDELRTKWAMVSERDYEIFTLEQNLLMWQLLTSILKQNQEALKQNEEATKRLRTISGWVTAFGVLLILSVIGWIFLFIINFGMY